jgi:multiple sugar transport system permease protein
VKPKSQRLGRRTTVLLLLSPWAIGFLLFTAYPMIATLYYSFTRFDLVNNPKWVGLDNYRFLLTKDPLFWQTVRNTLWLLIFMVPLRILWALCAAIVLTRPNRGRSFYRTLYFLPTMVPAVAATLAFVFILNVNGPVNHVLHFLHLGQPLWFQDPRYAKPALVLLGLWGVGDTMIIFLAGLLDVPAHLHEAAVLDGANAWQRFRYVTFPSISPVVFFSLILGMIGAFQYFTEGYVASRAANGSVGAPNGSTFFYPLLIFHKGFEGEGLLGDASAMAWMLFVVIMIVTVLIIRSSRRWVFYQGGLK